MYMFGSESFSIVVAIVTSETRVHTSLSRLDRGNNGVARVSNRTLSPPWIRLDCTVQVLKPVTGYVDKLTVEVGYMHSSPIHL